LGGNVTKSLFVAELEAGEPVQSVFLARSVEMRRSRDGEPFLHLVLADRTGEVVGRAWTEPDMLASRVSADDFVALRGETKQFSGDLYIEVADLDRLGDDAVDIADFFATGRWSGVDLVEQLARLVDEEVESTAITRFLHEALRDDEVAARLAHAPAAMRHHHAFRGGLVEHILSMSRLALRVGAHYRDYYPGLLQTDLVVAGCILHDLAKVWELSWHRDVDYTDAGRLVGHIPMGIQFVRRVADRLQPRLDDDLVHRLEHLVASHHGQLEYGSPVRPQTPEAIILHQVDMIDSRLNMCWNEVRAAWESGSRWTPYSRSLEARIFAGDAPQASPPLPDGPGLSSLDDDDERKSTNLDLFEG
jgi:3'-5' exoribonuclease